VFHTAAYWLMLTVRDAIPKARELATAEFATLRLRLLKIAARVVEDHEPRAPRLRRCMSRSRPLPQLARRAAPARSVTDWACARSPAPIPPTRTKQVDVEPGEKAGRSPTPAASPPSDVKRGTSSGRFGAVNPLKADFPLIAASHIFLSRSLNASIAKALIVVSRSTASIRRALQPSTPMRRHRRDSKQDAGKSGGALGL